MTSARTLAGQRVVVIGGTSGIGRAVAEAALADGAEVVVASSNPTNVEAAAARLGAGARGMAVDVKDEASIAAFFAALGALDHLVFTAGDWGPHMMPGPIETIDVAAVQAALAVRFWGALLAVKHAKPRLLATGSVTLTSGVLAHRPPKGQPLIAAFGGAVEHLARGLAVDLAPIRVNAVCPGLVLTETLAQAPPEMVGQMMGRTLLGRGADLAEAVEAYLYAMRGGYTTGQVLMVDAGAMLA
jgi:NAD(P)-dependent dehydrogenase (short-subunit alcohol dehydrogenase family)